MANANKECKFCHQYKPTGSGVKFPIGWFCCYDHAKKKADEINDAKTKKAFAKKQKAMVKAEKSNHVKRKREFQLNDVKHQHKLTQTVFNKMRVLEEKKWFADKGIEPSCISCGKEGMDWCCGHLKTRGSQGNLRYDRINTFLQCNRYCNMALSGNINGNKNTRGYIKGLFERFGDDKANEIYDYCISNTKVKKWTGPELKAMRDEFNKKIKEMLLTTNA